MYIPVLLPLGQYYVSGSVFSYSFLLLTFANATCAVVSFNYLNFPSELQSGIIAAPTIIVSDGVSG